MAFLIGEGDQTFGKSSHCRPRTTHLIPPELGQLDTLQAYVVAKVTDQNGAPVPGVMFNVVDEDRITALNADVSDENGMVVLPAKTNVDSDRRNYARIMLTPVGYGNPSPRTQAIDVPFYGVKPKIQYGALQALLNRRHTKEGKTELDAVAKLKPDFTFTVQKIGDPIKRTALPSSEWPMRNQRGGAVPLSGTVVFRVIEKDGTIARPDRDTPYTYQPSEYSEHEQTADIDSNGMIWLGWTAGAFPTKVVPWFGGRYQIGPNTTLRPDLGFTRLLKYISPWPYVYDIKHTEKDGGLLPAGRITDEEIGGTASTQTPSPSPGTPSPDTIPDGKSRIAAPPASKAGEGIPWGLLLLVGGISAVAWYFLWPQISGGHQPSFAGLGRRSRRRKKR